MADAPKTQNQVARLEDKIKSAVSVKELFTMPDVKDRFIRNYQAVTGRQDGENRLEQERFAYLQLVAEKEELRKVDNFFHFSALVYAGTTGLSFRDNKLYVIPNGKGGLKVQSSPAGKREMLCMMPDVLEAPEAILVMNGDHFVVDKLNNLVKEHWTTEKTNEKIHIDNIRAVYQRIVYKNGKVKDTVVYHDDLVKAKSKSKMTGENSTWNTWPGEMAKKVATNRAFRLYHKYPDNVVVYGKHDEEDTTDTLAEEVSYEPDPTVINTASGDQVDTSSGEVMETEEVKDPVRKKAEKPNLLDD